ncbi:MAG: RpiB/LacA/LacB family sugar-phosphate isomerase [Nanoarchaeota archaeon]
MDREVKRVYIGADHAGFKTKERLKKFLKKKYDLIDCGAFILDKNDDYPNYAFVVAEHIVKDAEGIGILVCGSGNGMAIAANKVHGARAVMAVDNYGVKMGREDNDANILVLRERQMKFEKNKSMVNAFLKAKPSTVERHRRRIRKIDIYHS